MKCDNVIQHLKEDENKLIVQKSLPLFALWRSELTLSEFKILDIYLSRINSHKPDKRIVQFEKGELEKILGVKQIRTEELSERLKHLMGNVVQLEDLNDENTYRYVTLFEEAVAKKDNYGIWQIQLKCTEAAMDYIFNIEQIGYLRYKLRSITAITSRYAYILFNYLEANRFRKSWEITVEDLKKTLGCEEEESYKEFKRFNDKLLKRIKKELLDKTECKFDYETVKKGRSVVAIKFTVETLKDKFVCNPDINVPIIEYDTIDYEQDLWVSAICDNDELCEFDELQLKELRELIITIPEIKLPANNSDIDIKRYHYIALKYAELNRISAEKQIKNRFAYFKKMIQNDAHIEK